VLFEDTDLTPSSARFLEHNGGIPAAGS